MSTERQTTRGRQRTAARSRIHHGASTGETRTRAGRWSTDAVRAREQAREEERRRLARELHDELGQALLALKMNMTWLQHRVDEAGDGGAVDANEIRQKLPNLLDQMERAIHTVTAIVTDLRPPALDQLGLIAALEWQTESFGRRTGLRCRFTGTADVELDVGRATAVFRMFQEMLTNVERHAQANHVVVIVQRLGNRLKLSVRDNGRGVSANAAHEPSSFGLLGMQERAMLLGGTLTIKGAPQRGTTVTAIIPLANRRALTRNLEGEHRS